MHEHLCALHLHACKYCSKSAKIIVSIHWTLLSNIHFLHRPQILHCFKAIKKYRNAHAHLCEWCSHACSYHSRILKILVSIYLTLLRNFYFLHRASTIYYYTILYYIVKAGYYKLYSSAKMK